MAKLVINVNTETGELTATVNGVAVEDVSYVSCYSGTGPVWPDDPNSTGKYASFTIESSKKDNGVTVRTCVVAKKTPEGQEAIRLGGQDSEIPECVIDVSKASRQDIDVKLKENVFKFLRQGR